MEITFDLAKGDVLVDMKKFALIEGGKLLPDLNGNFRDLSISNKKESEVRFDRKFTLLNSSASLVLRMVPEQILDICILFDEVVFFDQTILESKIIQKFQKKYGERIESPHATVAKVGSFNWGQACFSYDPRQGDLSLCFLYNSESWVSGPAK
jgi:hypothetical protein